jgi:hypothetical protein
VQNEGAKPVEWFPNEQESHSAIQIDTKQQTAGVKIGIRVVPDL